MNNIDCVRSLDSFGILPVAVKSFTANTNPDVVIYYDERQIVNRVLDESPSAMKPRLLMKAIKEVHLPQVVGTVEPVSREDLYAVHHEDYVDGVLEGKIDNGFGTRDLDVARSLLWTNGSMLSAAKAMVNNHYQVACSFTSGFHHACHSKGMGYCTFNGLMVVCNWLTNSRHYKPQEIGILDFDEHIGNGTEDIMHIIYPGRRPAHFTYGRWNGFWYGEEGVRGQEFIHELPEIMNQFKNVKFLIYQAGADPHVNSKFSRNYLTTEQLKIRDRYVFEFCRLNNIKILWCLAGGYSSIEEVIEIHLNTYKQCLEVFSSDN